MSDIKKQIEAVKAKKVSIIDMAADGLISGEDLQTQNYYYDRKLEQLYGLVSEDKTKTETRHTQTTLLNGIRDILTLKSKSDVFLGELLDHAIVFPGHKAKIFLSGISSGILVNYSTSGKMEHFAVEVTGLSISEGALY
jgi:hypothetical protein